MLLCNGWNRPFYLIHGEINHFNRTVGKTAALHLFCAWNTERITIPRHVFSSVESQRRFVRKQTFIEPTKSSTDSLYPKRITRHLPPARVRPRYGSVWKTAIPKHFPG
ncbi:hypothetical protein Y032_0039g135 [Ancylostoma ceylanicum]|uniref:Uncharacterized protein n=1 Tax=Ancylostoma ceylanicum TaxID=53326 RepID=A0A016UHB1_9BILA|nr:hypothetical protein Y032_0039g135 [Ancylostoma ceylanicum]